MGRTPMVCLVVTVGLGGALVGLAACSQTQREALATPPGFGERPSASSDAAGQAEELTTARALHDGDGDGFVSPAEAEGYYRHHFGQLDDNDDGQLSRVELEPEALGTPDLEVAYEELVGATEREYVDDRLRRYDLRADQSSGMMSTKDFDELFGSSEPAINGARPGSLR